MIIYANNINSTYRGYNRNNNKYIIYIPIK